MIDINKLIELAKEQDRTIVRQKLELPFDNVRDAVIALGKLKTPSFVIDQYNSFCYENLIKWLMRDETMQSIDPFSKKKVKADVAKGLYIAGPTGTGKTMAVRLIRELAHHLGLKYKQDSNGIHALEWTDVRTDTISDEYAKGSDLMSYKQEPVICFQDLGSETTESVYMGNRMNIMKTIIESRGDRADKLTIFTSNMLPNDPDMIAKYGDRAVSRLLDMCNILVITGQDRRNRYAASYR